jgi:2-oxo-3-hexenedioate decarboxylase
MLSALDLHAISVEMKDAQDSVRTIDPFTSRTPGFDLAAAYAVADQIHRARVDGGARPVGRKIGFTNSDMWTRYGVRDPIWAFMYDTTVVQLQNTRAVSRLGGFSEPKIEPEIVFGFRTAPHAGAGLAEILDAIDWIAHGFEIVQSHFPGWKFQAPDTVADSALHGALLVGPTRPVSEFDVDVFAALESFQLTLYCGDQRVETGRGSNVLGSPLAAIDHLLAVLAQQSYASLQAGEIVTTGTITTAQTVHAGEIWRSELRGIDLPALTVEFTV